VIAMVFYPQTTFDQIGDPLCGPQLRSVSVCRGSLHQETNESIFLFRGQPGRPTRCGLGLQGILPAGSQRISPTKHTASVATDASGNFMEGEFQLEECDRPASTIFQRFWRTLRSHGDTPY
jgi:hypothetical protein